MNQAAYDALNTIKKLNKILSVVLIFVGPWLRSVESSLRTRNMDVYIYQFTSFQFRALARKRKEVSKRCFVRNDYAGSLLAPQAGC